MLSEMDRRMRESTICVTRAGEMSRSHLLEIAVKSSSSYAVVTRKKKKSYFV